MVNNIEMKYNDLALTYDAKYVDDVSSSYMFDEFVAKLKFTTIFSPDKKIISLGCGTGQDVSITAATDGQFVGFDISEEMLKCARSKFPNQTFIKHDCTNLISHECDILVSIFGVPNYLGTSVLKDQYKSTKAKHAFFIFYDEKYEDGVIDQYFSYSKLELMKQFNEYNPSVCDLFMDSNYYVVYW